VSKRLLVSKSKGLHDNLAMNCNGNLLTGYRLAGIKAAGSLHRLLFGTWETASLMCQGLCRNSDCQYWKTVHQMIYGSDCNSISLQMGEAMRSLGRSHSSDEIPVMGMERRASVILLKYFETTV
jgi:hypothetical protein